MTIRQQPGSPSWAAEQVGGASQVKVDPRFIESLMTTGVETYVISQSDEIKDLQRLPDTILSGNVGRVPDRFYPPESHSPRDSHTRSTQLMWRAFSDLVLKKAFYDAFMGKDSSTVLETLRALASPAVQRVYMAYEAGGRRNCDLWFQVDTATMTEPAEIQTKVDALIRDVKNKVRASLEKILGDQGQMKEIYRTVAVLQALDVVTAVRSDIDRINSIRGESENLEDRERLLAILKEMAHLLGVGETVEIELLRPEDYVLLGAQGLYTRKVDDAKPVISVPMTNYASGELLSLHDIMEIFAHEVAHHQIDEFGGANVKAITGTRDHNLLHTAMTERNMRRLREAEITPVFEEDGTISGIRLVHPERFIDAKAQESDVDAYNNLIEETFRFLGVENQGNVHVILDHSRDGLYLSEKNGRYISFGKHRRSVDQLWEDIVSAIVPDYSLQDYSPQNYALRQTYMARLRNAHLSVVTGDEGTPTTFTLQEVSPAEAPVAGIDPAKRVLDSLSQPQEVTADLQKVIGEARGLIAELTAIREVATRKAVGAGKAKQPTGWIEKLDNWLNGK